MLDNRSAYLSAQRADAALAAGDTFNTRLSATHTIEVWAGIRKVARVKKENVPLTWTDRLAD